MKNDESAKCFFLPDRKRREEIRRHLKGMSDDVSVCRLCRSILGADVDVYKIGRGSINVLYVGTHHGSEHITGALLYEFINTLLSVESPSLFGVDRKFYMRTFTLWVIPVLNSDGAELSINGIYDNPLRARQERMAEDGDFLNWQANARGVDLNHNYRVGFDEYKIIESERGILPGKTLYSGEYPESEPESRALANLVRSVDFSIAVSLHSQGEEIYYFPVSSSVAGHLAKCVAEITNYTVSTPSGTAKYGGFCDFTGDELNIPSLTLEIGKGQNPLPYSEFLRCKDRIVRTLWLLPTYL